MTAKPARRRADLVRIAIEAMRRKGYAAARAAARSAT